MTRAALALLALGSCSYSLADDAAGLRTEIVGLERSVPPESPLWIAEGPNRFDPFLEDRSPHVPDFIYHHLLRRLHGMADREPDAQSQGDFDRAACEKEPSMFRGRFWRVHGVIADLHPEPLEDPRHPVRVAHAGVLFDETMQPVLFHVVDKPDVLTLREDTVEAKAVFVKIIEYTSRSGRKVAAPLFIGKSLRRTL
jgi:hypothetical protein